MALQVTPDCRPGLGMLSMHKFHAPGLYVNSGFQQSWGHLALSGDTVVVTAVGMLRHLVVRDEGDC